MMAPQIHVPFLGLSNSLSPKCTRGFLAAFCVTSFSLALLNGYELLAMPANTSNSVNQSGCWAVLIGGSLTGITSLVMLVKKCCQEKEVRNFESRATATDEEMSEQDNDANATVLRIPVNCMSVIPETEAEHRESFDIK